MTAAPPIPQPRPPRPARLAAWLDPLTLLGLLLLAPLFLFPFGLLPWLGLGLALLLALARWVLLGRPPLAVIDMPLLFLLALAVLGLLISVDRLLSWPRFWSLVYGLLVYAFLRRLLRPDRQAGWIALALALAGIALAGVSLLGTDWTQVRLLDLPWLYQRLPALLPGLPGSGVPRASELINPRWVGISLGVLAPLYLVLAGWRGRPWLAALMALAFLIAVAVLLLTQTLQGLLGLIVGCFVVLVFASRWFWLLLPAGLLAAAALLATIGPSSLAAALLSIHHPLGAAVVLRLDIWSRALAMLHDMPYTGIGLNNFPWIQSQFYTGYLIGPEPHAHNLYLQTALDLGLPGLLAFLWFLLLWGWMVLERLRRPPGSAQYPAPGYRLLLIGLLAAIASYLAHGFFDAMMLGAKPTFIVWALLGIGAARPLIDGPQPKTPPLRLALAGLALPLLFGLLALLQPAGLFMNLGALAAQRLLYPFPPPAGQPAAPFAAPQALLETALRLDPDRRQAHLLLGRIASLQGRYPAAQEHYARRVALDLHDPLAGYNPAGRIQSWIDPSAPSDPTAELYKIYSNWNARFPERAEGYLLLSLLAARKADPARVQAILQAGEQAGARPLGLLLAAREAP